MKQIAFILINSNSNKDDIVNIFKNFSEVLEMNKVEGPYYIILKLCGESTEKIKEFVLLYLKKNDKIKHFTC